MEQGNKEMESSFPRGISGPIWHPQYKGWLLVSRKPWTGDCNTRFSDSPQVWLTPGLGTYRSNTKKKKVLVS